MCGWGWGVARNDPRIGWLPGRDLSCRGQQGACCLNEGMEDSQADLSTLMTDFEQHLENFGHDVEEQVFEAASTRVPLRSQALNAESHEEHSTTSMAVRADRDDVMDAGAVETSDNSGTEDNSGADRATRSSEIVVQSDVEGTSESASEAPNVGTESDNVAAQNKRHTYAEQLPDVETTVNMHRVDAKESNACTKSRALARSRHPSRDLVNSRPATTANILEEYFHRLQELRLDAQSQSLVHLNDVGDLLTTADTTEHEVAQGLMPGQITQPSQERGPSSTASATVRVRMTRAKAHQVRQRMLSQLKRQGVGTRSFAKFKHEICHRAGLVVHFSSFFNDADSLPDVLT